MGATASLAFDIVARDRASKQFDKVGDSAHKSTGRLKAFALVGAAAVAGAAVVAGKALFDMAKGAAEDEKAAQRLATTLKNTTGATSKQVGAVEDWITAQGKALGVTDDQLRPAIGKLATATGDLGEAQKLASLAMDISAGSGKSLESVSAALAKAQNGQMGGLSKLGVKIKDADGATRSLNDITKDLANTYSGQAAAAANTTEGKWARLKLQWDEAKETLGSKLLPIGEKVADFLLNKFGPAAGRVGDWFKTNLLPPLRDAAEKIAPKLRDAWDKVKAGFRDAQPFLELVGKFFTNVVIPVWGNYVSKIVLPVLGKAVEGIGKALGAVGRAGTAMWNNALAPVIRFMLKGFAMVTEGWSIMLRGLSKVPGFGWAADAADKMAGAAAQARDLAAGVRNIPTEKTVNVNLRWQVTEGESLMYAAIKSGAVNQNPIPLKGSSATGTSFTQQGWYRVGEQGPETVFLPRGSRVVNAGETARMGAGASVDMSRVEALLGELVRLLSIAAGRPDAGELAYLQGARF